MDIFHPIQLLADQLVYQSLDLDKNSYLGGALNFFIYDTIKIGLLLVLVNYLMAIIRYYFPIEKVRDILAHNRWYGLDYLFAALLGMITPFCSCSSIPLFIGFVSAGIPLGVTLTFLISSPLVNEASLYLFPAIFGLKNTLIYNFIGLSVSILGGILIQKLNMNKYIRPEFLKLVSKPQIKSKSDDTSIPFKDLLSHWTFEAFAITKQIFPYVIIGVAVGAIIHGFVPQSFIITHLSSQAWWTIPLAVILGAPLYANSIAIIPIIEAIISKGVPMGTALAFLTATVTISIPEALMLSKIMQKPLLLAFFGITIIGIILMGYILNFIT